MRRPADPERSARREWTWRKHRVLENYLSSALGRLCAEGRTVEVVLYDAFAGRGEEPDGQPVSAVRLARLAESCAAWEKPVRVHLFLSESRKQSYDRLHQAMESWIDREVVTLLRGIPADHQGQVLEAAEGHPLFVILDPFTPNELPFHAVQPFLEREESTELLIIFFSVMISRVLSTLQPDSRTPPKLQEEYTLALEELFGGDGWRGLLSNPRMSSNIIQAYVERLRALPSFRTSALPHAIRVQHGELLWHHLILYTRRKDSLPRMNDAFHQEATETYQRQGQLLLPSLLLAESSSPTVELDSSEQQHRAELLMLAAVRTAPALLPRGELIHRCMVAHFGEFSETEWRRAVKRLVARTSGPRLKAPGALSGKGGAPQLNDVVRLRYTE